MRQLLTVALVAALVTGCGRGDFALRVQVNAPVGSTTRCMKVTATRGADALDSAPTALTADSSVDVLIALDSTADVTVQAAGYDNGDCAGAPVEQSEQRTSAPTKTAPFPVVQLTLAPVTTNTDGGTDAGFDAGFDAGADDAGFDAGMDDAGSDAGMDDAGFDAGMDDAGFDAGIDDAGVEDAGFDAGTPDAGPECTLATVGQSCSGGTGTCNFQNVCLANFPYPVSNFSIADLPAPDGGNVWVVTGNWNVNSDNGDVTGQPDPSFDFLTSDAGYGKVLLIHIEGLIIADGGSLTFTNVNPVIIAVNGDAIINGTIIANSGTGLAALCGPSIGAAGGQNSINSSGAGGGGFGMAGARGGEGSGTGTSSGDGGLPSGDALLQPLRGGCAGGKGGNGGNGGAGGGALQISVRNTLTINGIIAAPGTGGAAGGSGGKGGGGGGSGGAVAFETSSLLLSPNARVTANGGGGAGGGGSDGAGGTGETGHTNDATPASGGTAGTMSGGGTNFVGSPGGAGGTRDADAAPGESVDGGGGGGGGAVGRIRFNTVSTCINDNAVISPAPALSAALITDAGC